MVYGALFDAYKANQKAGGSRQDFLLKAAQIPGIYVPSLYKVTYKEDGTIESFQPKYENVPEKVEKQLVIDMDKDYNKLEAPVVPHIKATQGSCYSGNPTWLYPRMPFLPGWHDLPSD